MHRQPDDHAMSSSEQQIDAWRSHLRASNAIAPADAAELEDHLREQISALCEQGLSEDEAFLVAVKRMGAIDALTREFAREHSDRLWKQLVLTGDTWDGGSDAPSASGSRRMWVALGLAIAAGIAIKVPELFQVGFPLQDRNDPRHDAFYLLNMAFFTLPFIAAYFAWERPLPKWSRLALLTTFGVAAVLVNLFPFTDPPGADLQVFAVNRSHTLLLTSIHLPIALWLAVGVAYVGGLWRGSERRMDFVRFTGELFIYCILIALGGGVLIGLSFGLFQAIGVEIEPFIGQWIVPCGIAGATVIASWLVEAKQSVIENMAPVLTRIFTPLFALVLLVFLGTMLSTGRWIRFDRDVLIIFDLLLVVVFALLLYSFSARDPLIRPGLLDWIQLTLVVSALLVDVFALWAIGARISEYGFTPNRTAALGENVVLLANLLGTTVLYAQFLRRRRPFVSVLKWQTGYLYVFAAWAAVVAFLFPPLFGFG